MTKPKQVLRGVMLVYACITMQTRLKQLFSLRKVQQVRGSFVFKQFTKKRAMQVGTK